MIMVSGFGLKEWGWAGKGDQSACDRGAASKRDDHHIVLVRQLHQLDLGFRVQGARFMMSGLAFANNV